jgi:hypothetical protein
MRESKRERVKKFLIDKRLINWVEILKVFFTKLRTIQNFLMRRKRKK